MTAEGSIPAPEDLWRQFTDICAIPHPSGHEEALREMLARRARDAGLAVRTDRAGNLRIDRPAAPGREQHPLILLQGHLDMVPQVDAGTVFDFLHDPIAVEMRDGWMTSAGNRTSLGADNGIGLAAAMALLLDPGLDAGPLALLATVQEETGMAGAFGVDPEFLECGLLLNLDTETEGDFCLGCAGGVRLEICFRTDPLPCPSGLKGARIAVSGMKGGHSGTDIGLGRGNALCVLLDFLAGHHACRIAEFHGGSLDNAIPREAAALVAIPPDELPTLAAHAAEIARELRRKFDVFPEFAMTVVPADVPETIWSKEAARQVVDALRRVPNGVLEYSDTLQSTVTSSNLAVVQSFPGEVRARCLTRSFDDAKRNAAARDIALCCVRNGASVQSSDPYPGWTPQPETCWLKRITALYREMFAAEPRRMAVHAGLECGIFAARRTGLNMLSIGPDIENPHSPSERVGIASVERFYRFLRRVLQEPDLFSPNLTMEQKS